MEKYILVDPRKIFIAKTIDFLGSPFKPVISRQLPDMPRKTAILLLDHIGDTVFATPLLRRLRAAFPGTFFSLWVGEWSAPLFESCKYVNEVKVFSAKWCSRNGKHSGGVLEGSRLLRAEHYDCAIDVRGDLRHILMMTAAGIPHRIGYGITGGGFLLTKEAPYPFDRHAVIKGLNLAKAMGLNLKEPIDAADYPLEVFPSEEKRQEGKNILRSFKKDKKLAAIHPGTGASSKCWPADNFIALGKELVKKGFEILVTGSKAEIPLAAMVAEGIGKDAVSLAPHADLGNFCGILEEVDLFFVGDTGPLHVAAALNVPTVAIFSATNDPQVWGPWGERIELLQTDLDCRLCGLQVCNQPEHHCMEGISVESVLMAADRVLAGAGADYRQ